jgi:peptide/nickel transport system permease protein
MLRFLMRRVLLAVPILFGVSVVVFATLKLTPGDPVSALLGPTSTPADRALLTKQLGLDKPIPVQFWHWLSRTLHGDLGRSIARQLPARPIVVDAFKNTLVLTAFAAVIAIVGGILIGAIAALRKGRPSSAVASGLSLFSVSVPQYSLGLMLIILFAAQRHLLPAGGMHNVAGNGGVGDLYAHLLLPGITAALVPLGIVARMFRSSLLEVLGQDYIEALRARGIPSRRLYLHAFHNTLPSLLTVAGLQLGYLLGGVIFVEAVFSWPGIGLLVFQSISQRDLPLIQAGVLVSALVFVVLNLAVDALHGIVDPRIRHSH